MQSLTMGDHLANEKQVEGGDALFLRDLGGTYPDSSRDLNNG
jgi:hypothetical protein